MLPPQSLRTFFVTAVTEQRRRLFQVNRNAELFLEVLNDQRAKRRMHIHAFVVMPDHIHLLLTPAADVSLEKSMQYVKGNYSFRLKSGRDVWERGYNEERVASRDAYERLSGYIEQNPVRAGLAESAIGFVWSSAGRKATVDPTPAWFA